MFNQAKKSEPGLLSRILNRLWIVLIKYIDEAPIPAEEKIRLQHFTVFLLLGIPTMLIYGAYNIWDGRYFLACLVFCSAFGLAIGWLLLNRFKSSLYIYRINSVLFASLILYMITVGGEDGSKILWMYIYPLIAFFLFGRKEGLFWSAAIFIVAVIMLYNPRNIIEVYPYTSSLKVRFITSYIIVSTITYWFEYFRQRYRVGMEVEQDKLVKEQEMLRQQIAEREKAEHEKEKLIKELEEKIIVIKKLGGLLPICASCHKIRDDQGYWNQLETYIQQHSEATFSHGVCPDCADEFYKKMPKQL